MILVADDDRLILATLTKGLTVAGYEVIQARDGQDAIEKAREHKPELALLDIRMPHITGIDAAAILKDELQICSIFLSAYDDKELVERAVRDGAIGYLVKPVEIRQIIPAIEAGLKRSSDILGLEKKKRDLVNALENNKSISVAIGILMERYHLGEIDAFDAIRNFARSERKKLLEIAEELVNTTDKKNELASKIHATRIVQ